jgi:hypothetical protein
MPKFVAYLSLAFNEVDCLDFDLIDRLGYDGWIGCAYPPQTGTRLGLGWLAPYMPLVRAAVRNR